MELKLESPEKIAFDDPKAIISVMEKDIGQEARQLGISYKILDEYNYNSSSNAGFITLHVESLEKTRNMAHGLVKKGYSSQIHIHLSPADASYCKE